MRKQYEMHGLAWVEVDGKRRRRVEYSAWHTAKMRCHNKNDGKYPAYGGRGIQMCERWRRSFVEFFNDMGEKPSPCHSLDRIDVNGNYEPGNCRWATAAEQANNKQKHNLITFDGVTKNISEWAHDLGTSEGTIRSRIKRGWPIERALTTPFWTYHNKPPPTTKPQS